MGMDVRDEYFLKGKEVGFFFSKMENLTGRKLIVRQLVASYILSSVPRRTYTVKKTFLLYGQKNVSEIKAYTAKKTIKRLPFPVSKKNYTAKIV